jgi:hypothetical protein
MAIVTVLVVAAAAGVLVARWRAPARRRSAGGWWWELAGAPLDAKGARSRFCNAVWTLIRGAAIGVSPSPGLVGRRYAEVLASGVGQPGFRDLLVVCTDLDARRDVVVALLSEPYRQEFLAPRSGRDRRAEVLDLAGADREYGLDVIAAAMTPPVACDPALVAFSADGFWRGEIHRLCDRPGAIHRVLEELSAAGVTQVILVSAVAASAGPHRLHRLRLDPRERLGDYLAAAESAALRDGLEKARAEFDGVYVVSPAHNAVGPFDLGGVYDEASDRQQALDELIERGYEDAYRQFIDPVVGEVGDGAVQEGV